MALSNWDTMAFGTNGKSCQGYFENNKGDSIEIYKNWIYVRSKDMWIEGRAFSNNVIAEIQEGFVEMLNFDIAVGRGPQNAVFIVALEHSDWDNKKIFGGIGCYGYEGGDFVGVLPDTVGKFIKWLKSISYTHLEYDNEYANVCPFTRWVNEIEKGDRVRYNQGDYYLTKELLGTNPTETIEAVGTKEGQSEKKSILN